MATWRRCSHVLVSTASSDPVTPAPTLPIALCLLAGQRGVPSSLPQDSIHLQAWKFLLSAFLSPTLKGPCLPALGRSPGEGNNNPLQYSCLGNPMGRGAWSTMVQEVAKESDTTEQLGNNMGTCTRRNLLWMTPKQLGNLLTQILVKFESWLNIS